MVLDKLATGFFLGILSAGNPCVLPLYPGFLAFLAGKAKEKGRPTSELLLGLLVLAGTMATMLAVALVAALLVTSVGELLKFVVPLSDGLLLLLGLMMLAQINPFVTIPAFFAAHVRQMADPRVAALSYGLIYGPIALPCNAPLVVSVFLLSFSLMDFATRLGTFVAFSLGFGIPLLAIALVSGTYRTRLARLAGTRKREINILAGLLLIAVALYDFFYVNLQFLRLYY